MTIDPAHISLERDGGHGRYSHVFADGSRAELSYVERSPGLVAITHTYTPSRHRGQGVAATLVARAVEDFRAAGVKVIPACWFARQQFDEHSDWADILHRRQER